MKFNFEIPAPLQLGTPISYYKGLLPDYRYLDISYLKMSFTGEIVGHCAVGDNDYTIRANVEGESVSSVEILDVLETDSFLDIPLSLPNRKFVKALKDLSIEFDHDRDGVTIPLENGSIALSYQCGKVAAICWDSE
ncbi:hypothetical protein ACQXZL_11230 [Corynebacterium diphtheriae]|uniref:hypothetical protein n=1 Tax=Corynebacterium diphtheriae TaxID=1717 RepID=UPI000246802A|nr:hypothetical protein [Corynebacterium diphtheriae]AEX75641.1 hypothetical protein CDHC02_0145 [Corynebacterium diphtheriae HC02]AEX77842.1 hypothetical protein CDHC03_0111 [Corynebacterium diphtheriae HC03]KJJ58961.1 hypothetical protein NG01_10585 [Corynebacterium diphtheriae]MBG9295826.1 hypothetical protein [Corynebacterium diphtheriae bv. gravis]MBG9313222.1 hypothetical protein [Corynebacterium diphtheriae bv. mitis]